MSLKSIQLHNIAVWHSEKARSATNDRDCTRHSDLADRLFIRAYWAR